MEQTKINYSYWMVWGRTCEGEKRWFMVRTTDDWDSDMVLERAREAVSNGTSDMASIESVQSGYDDDIYIDYE